MYITNLTNLRYKTNFYMLQIMLLYVTLLENLPRVTNIAIAYWIFSPNSASSSQQVHSRNSTNTTIDISNVINRSPTLCVWGRNIVFRSESGGSKYLILGNL